MNQERTPPAGRTPMTYSLSGVDLDRADAAKDRIKKLARSTFNASVVRDIGSFGGLFRPDLRNVRKPILVSSADGVGTKLKIAFMTGIHDTVGLDIVAHCANDILVQGAAPMFFMDYLACGRLDPGVVEAVVSGVARGCRDCQCVLLGGETAEMPDFYGEGEYDLAGFIVGMVDEDRILGAEGVKAGDLLIGLASSGLHTNGYSLVRKLFFEREKLSVESHVPELGRTVGEELLTPHRNYWPILRHHLSDHRLHALAHVTGGGIEGNLSRVLQPGQDAIVRRDAWEAPSVFRFIQQRGGVEESEMRRIFNMGIGMILIVAETAAAAFLESLQGRGERAVLLGRVRAGTGKVRYE